MSSVVKQPLVEGSDGGFGIVEIVVSMSLLALLAIAFLPLLIQSLRVSVSNATLATATQLVAQQMEELRSRGTTCNDLKVYAQTELPSIDVGGNVALYTTISDIDCNEILDYPNTVRVTVSVKRNADTQAIATATTLMLVEKE